MAAVCPKAVILLWGWFHPSPGNIWQCLEKFFIVITGICTLGRGGRVYYKDLLGRGQGYSKYPTIYDTVPPTHTHHSKNRIIQSKMSTVWLLKDLALWCILTRRKSFPSICKLEFVISETESGICMSKSHKSSLSSLLTFGWGSKH